MPSFLNRPRWTSHSHPSQDTSNVTFSRDTIRRGPLTMCKHEKAQSGVIGAFIISISALRRISESGPKRNEERGGGGGQIFAVQWMSQERRGSLFQVVRCWELSESPPTPSRYQKQRSCGADHLATPSPPLLKTFRLSAPNICACLNVLLPVAPEGEKCTFQTPFRVFTGCGFCSWLKVIAMCTRQVFLQPSGLVCGCCCCYRRD